MTAEFRSSFLDPSAWLDRLLAEADKIVEELVFAYAYALRETNVKTSCHLLPATLG
jgi:hypothetical protein